MRKDVKLFPTILGYTILNRLAELDRTQKWLAEQVGINRTLIGDIIYGRRPLPSARLDAFIRTLGLTGIAASEFEYDALIRRYGTTKKAA